MKSFWQILQLIFQLLFSAHLPTSFLSSSSNFFSLLISNSLSLSLQLIVSSFSCVHLQAQLLSLFLKEMGKCKFFEQSNQREGEPSIVESSSIAVDSGCC
jgi:hypothetical protein